MKPTFILHLFLILFVFLINGCKDQATNILTDNQPAMTSDRNISSDTQPVLAGAPEDVTFEIVTQTGKGPKDTSYVKPVIWDGVSVLAPNVVYYFRNDEERLAALSTVPDLLEGYKKYLANRASTKSKNSSPALASTTMVTPRAVIVDMGNNVRGDVYLWNNYGWTGWLHSWFAIEDYYWSTWYYDGAEHAVWSGYLYESCPGGNIIASGGFAGYWEAYAEAERGCQ